MESADMGHTIWVEVQGRPLKETADDYSTTHRLMDALDVLAGKVGVRALGDFYDYSELEKAYGDLGDDGALDGGEHEGNFSPEPTVEERQAAGVWFGSAVGLESKTSRAAWRAV
jgi:hypothetical protein